MTIWNSVSKRTISQLLAANVLLVAIWICPVLAVATTKALIIVDMQPYFIDRTKVVSSPENKRIVEQVLRKQVQLIEEFKRRNLPILLVEYEDSGVSHSEILGALDGYPLSKRVLKARDGLFDDRRARRSAIAFFRSFGVRQVVVVGANAEKCVKATILGALKLGVDVLAYSEGIATFNRTPFRNPYFYEPLTYNSYWLRQARFQQGSDVFYDQDERQN